MENFRFFALHYLNDWCYYDKQFVTNLYPDKSTDVRLLCIQDAAKYYKIARNFKTIPGENRLAQALALLDAVPDLITDENVDATVSDLATTFQNSYGTYAISAASKFLWIRHQDPVVIYDSRATQFLNNACGGNLGQCDYATYRREWLRQFTAREDCIQEACAELVRIKDFSLENTMSDEALMSLVGNRWFAQRVFDKFIWWNAGD